MLAEPTPWQGERKGRPSTTTVDVDLIEADDVSNLRLALAILRRRLPSLAAPQWNKVRLAFSSVITQIGAQAFLFVSTALALVALAIEQVARRLRRFDASGVALAWGPARWQRFMERLQSRAMEATGKLKYERMAAELFDETADLNKDGGVDRTELYCLCLRLYLTVTQYLPQVLTPPTKAQCDRFFGRFDLNADGRLDMEEFLLLASLLVEMLAMRIATQSAISLVLAPLAAASLVPAVAALHLPALMGGGPTPGGLFSRRAGLYTVGSMVSAGVSAFGAVLPGKLGAVVTSLATARAGAITALAAVIVALLVPLSLGLIDEYYELRSARTAARALRAARERRQELRRAQMAYEKAEAEGRGGGIENDSE